MPLLINLRDLEQHPVLQLEGQLPVVDLDLDNIDELIHLTRPVEFSLEVEKLEESLLVRGRVECVLDCECARCLKPFPLKLSFNHWTCHLPLEGEEKVPVANDTVDLTPFVREDILLEFPQHPLCRPECSGLLKKPVGKKKKIESGAGQTKDNASAWAELNKLKF